MSGQVSNTSRKGEVAELETQLRIMSQAAADAIERASRLELELETSRSMSSSSSSSSITSINDDEMPLSPTDRLNILENAVDAIFKSRAELAKPYNYQYF